MDTFEKLELEKRNIVLAKLKNEKVDFSSLREAAKEHAGRFRFGTMAECN